MAVDAFLRKHVNLGLKEVGPDYRLQKQPYDHVLKEKERERDAFQAVAYYIAENPVRAGLVEEADRYPYTGTLVPGYPELDFRGDDYWVRFWRTHPYLCKQYAAEESG